jgi:hypothetical protein
MGDQPAARPRHGDDDGRHVEIVGVYEFPVPLGVTQGCLGTTVPIELGGSRGKATLPVISWEESTPHVTLPCISAEWARLLTRTLERNPKPSAFWDIAGRVSAYNALRQTAQEIWISCFILRFKVPTSAISLPDEALGRTSYRGVMPPEIRIGIEPWFVRLRTWIEAAVDQDTDPDNPVVSAKNGRLSLFANVSGNIADLASWGGITVTRSDFEPLNLRQLRRVVAETNAGRLPGDAHLLLRDARAALRRKRTRIAVIDAGTSVELTLAAFNSAGPNLKPRRGKPTLGWYVNELGAHVPGGHAGGHSHGAR